MKTKKILIRSLTATLTLLGTLYFIYRNNVVIEFTKFLLLLAGLLLVLIIAFRSNYKNFGFGLLYGLISSVGILIVYLFIELFNRLFGT